MQYDAWGLMKFSRRQKTKANREQILSSIIERSQIIKLGDIDDARSIAETASGVICNPPFDTCIFEIEYEGSGAFYGADLILVNRIDDHIDMYLYKAMKERNNWGRLDIKFEIKLDGEEGIKYRVFFDETKKFKNDQAMHEYLRNRCFIVAQSFEIMACSNVELKSNTKHRKGAGRRDKKPVYSFWTLHISNNGSVGDRNNNGGTHQSPRLHLRRGHIRRLQSGLKIWVNSCMVGTKDNGIVEKDYELN